MSNVCHLFHMAALVTFCAIFRYSRFVVLVRHIALLQLGNQPVAVLSLKVAKVEQGFDGSPDNLAISFTPSRDSVRTALIIFAPWAAQVWVFRSLRN